MFELLVAVFTLAAIGFLGAAVALLHPFKPFGTRMSALRGMGLSLLCGIAAMFGAAILTETPTIESASGSPLDLDDRLARSRERAANAGPSRADRIAAEAKALAEARAAAEQTSAAVLVPTPAPSRAPSPAAAAQPPEASVGVLMASISAGEWKAASLELADLRRGGYDLSQTLLAAERAARAKVRGIPPSNPSSARDGYLLLASIDPNDAAYPEKAEGYAAAAEQVVVVDPADKLVRRESADGAVRLEHPDRPQTLGERSTVLLAIVRQGDGPPWLEMRIVYSGRRWVFVDSVDASVGGSTQTLSVGWFERQQGGDAFEWRDERPDADQLALLRRLAASDGAILRFHGMQEDRDEPLSRVDRAALAEVLAVWDVMTGP